MLHILFLILKIIGIILSVILGILVLLVCIVLFVPVSYQGSGKCDGTLDSLCGILKISWLFKLVQVDAKYENGNLKYSIKIAWKKITGGKSHEKSKEKTELKADTEQTSYETTADQESKKVVEEPEENLESIAEEIAEGSCIPEEPEKETESMSVQDEKTTENSEKADSTVKEKISLKDKVKNKVADLKKKVLGICDKIKCTIKSICDKLKMLLEKRDKVMQFIQDRNHIKAFLKLKKEVFKLLRRLRPKEFAVKARYGFEDPALTGKILAVLSMIYPFTEEHMDIIPDFENKVLNGRIMIRGRIYIIYFVCTAWNLVWCKYVRMLYKDVRNFKL